MRKPYFIPLILAVSFLISGYTGKPIYCITDPTRPHVAGAETAVDAYLKAVDRGELKVFDKKIDRSRINPARVEYFYEIASGTTEIRAHTNLKDYMAVPNQPGAKVRSVSSVIEDGKIVETESHVWFE